MRKLKALYNRIKKWVIYQWKRHNTCRTIKKHFSNRYYNIMNSYFSGNLSDEDVANFTQYEPSIFNQLKQIYAKKEDLQKEEAYKARMDRDGTLCDLLLQETEEDYALLVEEEMRVSHNPANSPEDIKQKLNKLEMVRKRKEQTEFIIADLKNVKEALHPKRKPGRPPKNPKPKETPKPAAPIEGQQEIENVEQNSEQKQKKKSDTSTPEGGDAQ